MVMPLTRKATTPNLCNNSVRIGTLSMRALWKTWGDLNPLTLTLTLTLTLALPKVTLGGILKKCTTTDDKAKPKVDELEEYLAMPLEDTDIVLLDWWKKTTSTASQSSLRWPSSSQYLAAPASTAGVERVFSAAGRMHNDLRTSR